MTRRSADTRDAWRDLFTATYPTLAGWVRRLVEDDETAHEVASEAFTRLMSHWSSPDDPHAYLYKIATNLIRDHWHRARRRRSALRSIAAGLRDEQVPSPDSGCAACSNHCPNTNAPPSCCTTRLSPTHTAEPNGVLATVRLPDPQTGQRWRAVSSPVAVRRGRLDGSTR